MSEHPAPRRNLEIKARVHSLNAARQIAQDVATEHLGVAEQTDTFFRCANGRLKVREVAAKPAELIAYQRPDTPQAKGSDYYLIRIEDAASLIAALSSALGVGRVVRKRREIYLYHNVRIHLDEVDGLGEFLELESVISPGIDEATAAARLAELIERLGIQDSDMISVAYADLLAAAT